MTTEPIEQEGGIIREMAEQYRDEFVQQQRQLDRVAMGTAYGRAIDSIQSVLLSNLDSAVEAAPEYSYPGLKGPLENCLLTDGFVRVYGTISSWVIEFDYDNVLGSEEDFWDGIYQARAILGVGNGKTTPAQRAAFWRYKIYEPYLQAISDNADEESEKGAQRYIDTIYTRVNQWGGKAPYWRFLEYGNSDGQGAFPENGPTMFLADAQDQARTIFRRELNRVVADMGSDLNLELLRFLDNPRSGQPRQIFEEFYVQGTKYFIYVTPERRLLGLTQRIN